MNKTHEIVQLDKVIKQFGPDSYVGPWLEAHRGEIVYAIINDLPIDTVINRENHDAEAALSKAVEKG